MAVAKVKDLVAELLLEDQEADVAIYNGGIRLKPLILKCILLTEWWDEDGNTSEEPGKGKTPVVILDGDD